MNSKTHELLEQLYRLEWLLRYRHMRDQRERGPMGNPHRGQGRILALLKLQPEIDQRELATILDIRPQSLGELLAKLERQGYITRSSSESDKRVMEIHLTEAGRLAAEETPPSQDAEPLFDCLTENEAESLGDYLNRLIKDWESRLGSEAEGADPRMGWGGRGRGRPGEFTGFGGFGRRGPQGYHPHGRGFGGGPPDRGDRA